MCTAQDQAQVYPGLGNSFKTVTTLGNPSTRIIGTMVDGVVFDSNFATVSAGSSLSDRISCVIIHLFDYGVYTASVTKCFQVVPPETTGPVPQDSPELVLYTAPPA